eukprot:m.299216 g.299216  ORF g.299216 m.299216 type:complete len:986 (-) comp15868_c0_seq1:103-3060(-)
MAFMNNWLLATCVVALLSCVEGYPSKDRITLQSNAHKQEELTPTDPVSIGNGWWVRFNATALYSCIIGVTPSCFVGRACSLAETLAYCEQFPPCQGVTTAGETSYMYTCASEDCGAKPTFQINSVLYGLENPPPVTPAPTALPPSVEDWFFPASEQEEMESLDIPTPVSINVKDQNASIRFTNGTETTIETDQVVSGWRMLGAFNYQPLGEFNVLSRDPEPSVGAPVLVLMYGFKEWGMLVYRSVNATYTLSLRKPVGTVEGMVQPQYNLTGYDPNYFSRLANLDEDFIADQVLNATSEPSFADMKRYLPPAVDNTVISLPSEQTAWNVGPTGRIRIANSIIMEAYWDLPMSGFGNVVFFPEMHLNNPQPSYSAMKNGRIHGPIQIANVGVWNATANSGYEVIALAPTRGSLPVVVALREVGGSQSGAFSYYAGNTTQGTIQVDGAQFHNLLLNYHRAASANLTMEERKCSISVPYADRRQQHMVEGAFSSYMAVARGLHPNYGTGFDYWSPTVDFGESLPLTIIAVADSFVEWGMFDTAKNYLGFYYDNFIYPNGTIDMTDWKWCTFFGGQMNDGLPDYGRLVSSFVRVAMLTQDKAWVNAHLESFVNMTTYMLAVRENAVNTSDPDSYLYGLIFGPAEHDTCTSPDYYVSIQAWFIRGMDMAADLFDWLGVQPNLASALRNEADELSGQLQTAIEETMVWVNGTLFIPPRLDKIQPFAEMTAGVDADYSNFRYYPETLYSGVLSEAQSIGLQRFRETFHGTVAGLTRYRERLDNMPSAGYAYAMLATDRIPRFLLFLNSHMANYMSPGSNTAPEQLGIFGDSFQRLHIAQDYLFATESEERDFDYCAPSVLLVALMTRWQFVFDNWVDTELWLGKALPSKWYTTEGVSITNAPTRFGAVTFDVTANATATTMNVALNGTNINTLPTLNLRFKNSNLPSNTTYTSASVSSASNCAAITPIPDSFDVQVFVKSMLCRFAVTVLYS